jgi:hypothetical protein
MIEKNYSAEIAEHAATLKDADPARGALLQISGDVVVDARGATVAGVHDGKPTAIPRPSTRAPARMRAASLSPAREIPPSYPRDGSPTSSTAGFESRAWSGWSRIAAIILVHVLGRRA